MMRKEDFLSKKLANFETSFELLIIVEISQNKSLIWTAYNEMFNLMTNLSIKKVWKAYTVIEEKY